MFQENGKVNENQEAILELNLNNGEKIECLIDTGFSGTLFLPRKFVEENGLEIGIREILQAAENQFFEVNTATAEIHWLDRKFFVPIYVSETGESLIGTELLTDSILEIDYISSTVSSRLVAIYTTSYV